MISAILRRAACTCSPPVRAAKFGGGELMHGAAKTPSIHRKRRIDLAVNLAMISAISSLPITSSARHTPSACGGEGGRQHISAPDLGAICTFNLGADLGADLGCISAPDLGAICTFDLGADLGADLGCISAPARRARRYRDRGASSHGTAARSPPHRRGRVRTRASRPAPQQQEFLHNNTEIAAPRDCTITTTTQRSR